MNSDSIQIEFRFNFHLKPRTRQIWCLLELVTRIISLEKCNWLFGHLMTINRFVVFALVWIFCAFHKGSLDWYFHIYFNLKYDLHTSQRDMRKVGSYISRVGRIAIKWKTKKSYKFHGKVNKYSFTWYIYLKLN